MGEGVIKLPVEAVKGEISSRGVRYSQIIDARGELVATVMHSYLAAEQIRDALNGYGTALESQRQATEEAMRRAEEARRELAVVEAARVDAEQRCTRWCVITSEYEKRMSLDEACAAREAARAALQGGAALRAPERLIAEQEAGRCARCHELECVCGVAR